MTRRRRHFQRELKKIALHFSLKLSQIQVLIQQAIGIDVENRKMILIERKKHLQFKIVDLSKVSSFSMKVSYKDIGAGDLENKTMDEFIQQMSIQLDHIDEPKTIDLEFFNSSENAVSELPQMKTRLEKWKGTLSSAIYEGTANRA